MSSKYPLIDKYCEKEKRGRAKHAKNRKKITRWTKKCEGKKYEYIVKLFKEIDKNNKQNLEILLKVLQKYYAKGKEEEKDDWVLTFQDFVLSFPEKTTGDETKGAEKLNFRRQHIFEAICTLVQYAMDHGSPIWDA